MGDSALDNEMKKIFVVFESGVEHGKIHYVCSSFARAEFKAKPLVCPADELTSIYVIECPVDFDKPLPCLYGDEAKHGYKQTLVTL